MGKGNRALGRSNAGAARSRKCRCCSCRCCSLATTACCRPIFSICVICDVRRCCRSGRYSCLLSTGVNVSNRLQSVREPALSPRAAASHNQVPVSFAVPAGAWQELDRRIRSTSAAGLAARRFCRQLRLRRYGIRVRALDRNCRQVYSAGSLPAEHSEHRASRPHAKVAAPTQRLTGHTFSCNAVAAPSVAVETKVSETKVSGTNGTAVPIMFWHRHLGSVAVWPGVRGEVVA
jgi:hypothetical protein